MGLRENVLRGGLKPQQRIRAQNAYSRKRRPQQEGDADRRMHGMMQSLVVMAAVALGNDHAGPGGQSGGKAHQRIDNAGSGTHCGQGFLAHKLADDDGIHRIIQLLKNQPENHGDCKLDQLTPDASLRHVRVQTLAFPGHFHSS